MTRKGRAAWERRADRAVGSVGLVTLAIGAALATTPSRAARALGLEDDPEAARLLGCADLVLAAGLFRGRPRWPWIALRAALNAQLARRYAARGRRAHAAGMAGLTLVDGTLAILLRSLRR